MPPDLLKNPFLEFLEDEPRASFFSFLPQNPTFGQQRFAEKAFQPWQSQYLGALGGQVKRGETPNLTFVDFLRNNFNFGREFRRAPTSQSGRGTSPFVSSGRFLLNL